MCIAVRVCCCPEHSPPALLLTAAKRPTNDRQQNARQPRQVPPGGPVRCLVLAPSRELADQIRVEAEKLLSAHGGHLGVQVRRRARVCVCVFVVCVPRPCMAAGCGGCVRCVRRARPFPRAMARCTQTGSRRNLKPRRRPPPT